MRKSAVFALILIICLCSCTNKPALPDTVYADEKEPATFSIPDMAFGETFTIRYVDAEDTLFGIEKYNYSEKEERFVHSFLRGFYKACADLRHAQDISIESVGTVISVSKPFALYHTDEAGNYYISPDRFGCVFIVENHIVGEFFISGVNSDDSSYSAGYVERLVKSLDERIGQKETARMVSVYPPDGTAPYAEVFEITGEDHESGIWFSFVVEQ